MAEQVASNCGRKVLTEREMNVQGNNMARISDGGNLDTLCFLHCYHTEQGVKADPRECYPLQSSPGPCLDISAPLSLVGRQ